MSDSDPIDRDPRECPTCGFTLAGARATLQRTLRSSEFPCEECLWSDGQVASLRTRLGFTVVGIDAGRFKRPEDAVDEILATLASIYLPHREELLAWVETLPEVQS